MGAMASYITSVQIVYSSVYSGAYQRKHQSSASLVFVWGIHRWPVNSPHKGPVTRKMFPFDDVIKVKLCFRHSLLCCGCQWLAGFMGKRLFTLGLDYVCFVPKYFAMVFAMVSSTVSEKRCWIWSSLVDIRLNSEQMLWITFSNDVLDFDATFPLILSPQNKISFIQFMTWHRT